LRHFTRTFKAPTEFWYVACQEYDFERLSSNTRSKVRRARKQCAVRRVSLEWLIAEGYPCYAAAHTRYERSPALRRASFEANERKCIGGPFECWGVFVDEKLVGYARCAVGPNYAATLVLKFHPDYLRLYSAYALFDALLSQYVSHERKLVNNGFRSLAHDTNMQQFLEQFSFQKVYCDLRIVYSPVAGLGIRGLSPFRKLTCQLRSFARIQNLLDQEQIQRSFSAPPATL